MLRRMAHTANHRISVSQSLHRRRSPKSSSAQSDGRIPTTTLESKGVPAQQFTPRINPRKLVIPAGHTDNTKASSVDAKDEISDLKMDQKIKTEKVHEENMKMQALKLVPKLNMEGYYTSPSIAELRNQVEQVGSAESLKSVSGFMIGRVGFGEVVFDGMTDLRGVDLDQVIRIERNKVSVDVERMAEIRRSLGVGEEGDGKHRCGLQGGAEVKLCEVYPKAGKGVMRSPEAAKDPAVLRRFTEKLHKCPMTSFRSYDAEGGVWRFRVDYLV